MRITIKSTILLAAAALLSACSPDDETYVDNTDMDISVVDHVKLLPNQKMVLADGRAQMELYPCLYTKNDEQIPESRVKDEWLEYISETSGVTVGRYFSTDNTALIGKTITARLRIKGTDIESDPVRFTVADPKKAEYAASRTIPVVFHVIQTKEEVEYYGGEYKQERIGQQLQRLNNMLSAAVSNNPVGVNTNIQLVMAVYDPNGKKLVEPGINRETVSSVFDSDYTVKESWLADMNTWLEGRSDVMWPADEYLNIWLVSDRGNKVTDFANQITAKCAPKYTLSGAAGKPEGIEWADYADGQTLRPSEMGIIYKIQQLDDTERDFYVQTSNRNEEGYYMPGYNDLCHYLGRYLGLLPTCNYPYEGIADDYCDDTMNYAPGDDTMSWYKTYNDCYFRAENLMDDPTGVHCSVSRDQAIRMHWVLNNCAGRQMWKSTFATSGE